MTVFADSSALFAILALNDLFHVRAQDEWTRLLDDEVVLLTSNYVLLETTALLQSRIGMDAVRAFDTDINPALEIAWIERGSHQLATASLAAANRRQLSLVDLTSFNLMRELGIDTAFTFDAHFAEQGFAMVPDQ